MSTRKGLFALIGVAAIVTIAVAGTLTTFAHDKDGPHKKLFGFRWYQSVQGGNYDAWMTLSTSQVWLECDGGAASCGGKWNVPFSSSLSDWNGQPSTVHYDLAPDQSPEYDINVVILDELPVPGLLGVSFPLDVNGEVCDFDSCTVWYNDILIADDMHSGDYGTSASRRATLLHELGHGISLRHESVNGDESVHYACGEDNTGPIPHSLMAYDCIDPVAVGGQGEGYIHDWDVCGVNHAYHDPTIGYASCAGAAPPTDTPPPPPPTETPAPPATATEVPVDPVETPPNTVEAPPTDTPPNTATRTATRTRTPTRTPEDGLAGDSSCDNLVTSVDSALILQLVAGMLSSLPCYENADVNGDGRVDSVDSLLILQYVAGFLHLLPAGASAPLSIW
jgi:hypothetical protein